MRGSSVRGVRISANQCELEKVGSPSGRKTTGKWIQQRSREGEIEVIMRERVSWRQGCVKSRDNHDHVACMLFFIVSRRKWPLQSAVYGVGRPGSLLLLPRVLADDRWPHV